MKSKLIKISLIVFGSILGTLLILVAAGLIMLKIEEKEQEDIQSFYANEIPVEPEEFINDFESIHNIVKDNYSLYKSKHIDMDSLGTAFSQRINGREIISKYDYTMLLREYFASLKCGHADIWGLDCYFAPYSTRFIEKRIFIDIASDWLEKQGFKKFDEIIAINGKSTPEWLDSTRRYFNASTYEYQLCSASQDALCSYSPEPIIITVLREGDMVMDITFNPAEYDKSEDGSKFNYNIIEGKALSDSTALISVRSMEGDVAAQFKKVYKRYSDFPNLIIDLRDNTGGNSLNGELICRYLIEQPQNACVSSRTITPKKNHYTGNLFVLIGTKTFSAAESFAIDLKESGNAVFVGTPTGGDTGNGPKMFQSENGISFRIPTREPRLSQKGFPLEGVGVTPDCYVEQTIDDYLNGIDTQMEYVLSLIKAE